MSARNSWTVFVAEGFGSGRLPGAPGTWGTLVGLVWFALLLLPGNPWFALGGAAVATVVSIPLCHAAERRLGREDPGSVVLDEIIAVPWCFAILVADQASRSGFPNLMEFLQAQPWWVLPAGFLAFRFFDILKPFPIRQLQALPGGWGVVVDDVLAALWVAALSLLIPT